MAKANTLPEIYQPMMGKPSVNTPWCAVCGRHHPLESHHMVPRSTGTMFDEDGKELDKPTIVLCGFGNNLKDADGREYCHGLAHHKRLHFRWAADASSLGGHWEYLKTDEPCDYMDALEMEGWKRL